MDKKPSQRGRPTVHPIDRLRTKIWFDAVLAASELPTAYALEMTFDADRIRKRSRDVARPRKWDAYQKGSKVPQDKTGERNAIDQAEEKFPGTAKYFRSPLWDFLKRKAMSRYEIEDALRELEPAVTAELFESEIREFENKTRQKPVDENAMKQLITIITFDSLVAVVLLIGLSADISSDELRKLAVRAYLVLTTSVQNIPALQNWYEELFAAIDMCAKHWVWISPNQRLEVYMPWRGFNDYLNDEENRSASDLPTAVAEVLTTHLRNENRAIADVEDGALIDNGTKK